ncbi:histone-lysine N-methyltransferase PRDM9-like isoform X1 [Colias croceus]|uniref:histone-lysine N-methyltransferase PRDM9-like isoform X1 n=1 Tax=Colias crocea TaxID=72248 RepID=UPI001E27C797|nr:histone-lysine N-methyltransferase PRDM9-like isoform X1 [Colias croceus]
MRTYSRKPPDHQLIDGVLELCRLCLRKPINPMTIFDNDDRKFCGSLPMRIMICLGLEITNEECLPNMICSQCCRDLDNYYDFKKKCMLSYRKLKSHLIAVKELEVKKAAELKLKLENYCNFKSDLPEIDGEEGVNDLSDEDNEIILSLTDEDALEVINIFNETTACAGDQPEDEQVQEPSVTTSYNINDSLDFLNSVSSESIPPIPEDVTSFLSTILVQLGVLIKDSTNEKIVVIDRTFKNVRLETSDGPVILELVEEDEEPKKEPKKEEPEEPEPEREIDKNSTVEFVYNATNGILSGKAMCVTCGKHFATRAAMVRHERTHSGVRPYACDVCQRAFTQKEVLRRHQLTHQAERPFKCARCPKGFTQRAALRSHELTQHTPHLRPLALHRCKQCPKVFLHPSGLSRHMVAHTDRYYACNMCARAFKDKSSLLRHLKTIKHTT